MSIATSSDTQSPALQVVVALLGRGGLIELGAGFRSLLVRRMAAERTEPTGTIRHRAAPAAAGPCWYGEWQRSGRSRPGRLATARRPRSERKDHNDEPLRPLQDGAPLRRPAQRLSRAQWQALAPHPGCPPRP